jgi:Cys-tRNA synthase (O-phospho-L-seryl-tRNA:Cys-tRNA synthase)
VESHSVLAMVTFEWGRYGNVGSALENAELARELNCDLSSFKGAFPSPGPRPR